MDWRSVKFDWNRARAFLVTAEEGSLSAAARALGMAQPTLGRQVDALEQELGVVLFERVGRGFTLTPSGLELLDHVRAMGDAANRVSLTAAGQSQSIEGKICIAASETYAAILLPPIIAKLRQVEPGIHIEIVASTKASDLLRREADIAIRNFPRPSRT
jgi:DNA-binding transcriptional LysR family regulator